MTRLTALSGGGADILQFAQGSGQAFALALLGDAGLFVTGLQLSLTAPGNIGLLAKLQVTPGLFFQFRAFREQPARRRQPLQDIGFLAQDLVGFSLFGLAAGITELPLDLTQHVIEPVEVFLNPLELALAQFAPPLEQRETGGLLDQRAQFLRLGVNNFFDLTLLDDRVAAAVHLRGHEQFGNVL